MVGRALQDRGEDMYRYIIRRLLVSIPLLLIVSLLVFSIIRIVPGDVVMLMLEEIGNIPPEQLAKIRADMGLDRPFLQQFVIWLGGVVQGDLGESIWTGRSVGQEILRTLPITGELAILSLGIALCIAIPIGILSAVRRNSWLDYAGRFFAIVGLSVPGFALATIALLVFSLYVGWIPSLIYVPLWKEPLRNLGTMILPSLILGFSLAAVIMRMTRSAMLEVLHEDYIRTAWAKGLSERVIIVRHALKNAFIPIITMIGIQVRRLIGNTVVIETIFALPGIGRLTIDALLNRDYTQLQGCILLIAMVVVLINLVVDLSYAWFDPRIHYQ
jgi:peptide/nickel transport system permease protein